MPKDQSTSEADWADFSARLRTYVGHRVAPADADDVTGDILVRLVSHRDKLAAADNALAWVYRVAHNALVDFYRRKGSEERSLAEMAHVEDPLDPPDDQAAVRLSRCMIPFIEKLPPRYAQALMLTEIEGLTQRAAAQRQGVSVSGLKSRVQRGRRMLRDAVLRCCAVEADQRGHILDYRPRRVCCSSVSQT